MVFGKLTGMLEGCSSLIQRISNRTRPALDEEIGQVKNHSSIGIMDYKMNMPGFTINRYLVPYQGLSITTR